MAKVKARHIGQWELPQRMDQLDLFPRPRDWMLALASISIEDAERWRAVGWLSFDVRELYELHEGQINELVFVRNVSRAGLTEVQVKALLDQLERPYAYDVERTVYHFGWGWVQRPQLPNEEERDQFFAKHLPAWIEAQAMHGEHAALNRIVGDIFEAIARRKTAGNTTDTDEES